jgi:hypothetical protein
MPEVFSYDIYVLGLNDPSSDGRDQFATLMGRLTGRSESEFSERFPSPSIPMFQSLNQEKAQEVADKLGDAGVFVELRVSDAHPAMYEDFDGEAATKSCPSCGHVQSAMAEECERCGVVFQKYDREHIQEMQRDKALEEAMVRAMQVREEWLHRATQFLEQHPLKKEDAAEFSTVLMQEEVPFLRLDSDEGPILLTSRRMIANRDGVFESIPFEMISDVDFGRGGLVTTKKAKQRLQISFHSPFPTSAGGTVKNFAWHLDKESSFYKDVVIDWGFARSFICGACGERDLDYRTEGSAIHMRCMHCATDHEIELQECVAVPLIKE